MKPLTYLLVALSLVWIDIAYRAVMAGPAPVIVIRRIVAEPTSYVLPVQECATVCRAKARALAVSQKYAQRKP